MDAIDNRTASAATVNAVDDSDVVSDSIAAKADQDSQIAKSEIEKEIDKLQQEQQACVQETCRASNEVSATDRGTEWDPWRIMVIRRA